MASWHRRISRNAKQVVNRCERSVRIRKHALCVNGDRQSIGTLFHLFSLVTVRKHSIQKDGVAVNDSSHASMECPRAALGMAAFDGPSVTRTGTHRPTPPHPLPAPPGASQTPPNPTHHL